MMRRRDFLAAATAPAILRGQGSRKPNILFFLADDWGRYAGVYRDPARASFNDAVKTPSIDRVASEGVRFTNAFMATPSCTPSRAAIATGCYSFRTGSTADLRGGNWKGVKDPGNELPGFGKTLEASGYFIGSQFKTLGAKWLGQGVRGELREFRRFGQYVTAAKTESEAAKRKIEIPEQARASLKATLAARKPEQPFLHVYGPINTHRPWIRGSGKKLWGIDPDSLQGKLPAYFPDNPVVREDVADYLGEVQALDLMVGALLDELEKSGEAENTMVVLTGDNGMPGVPRGKCNLYDLGVRAPLLVRWPGRAKAGLAVDDFVNLMDLAPTFVEAAGLPAMERANGKSLVPLLTSPRGGTVDRTRDFVITSRERHVPDARSGNLPYPSRAIRTKDFLYIRNFKPERRPMGDRVPAVEAMSFDELAATHELLTYRDMDASPTKAWILKNRETSQGAIHYDIAFGKRPEEELYDLRKDPDQMMNVAPDPKYLSQRNGLSKRLTAALQAANDPRLRDEFDKPPYVE